MWLVWMLEIWIIIVIIDYCNGYKCCSLCCKCYNLNKACSKHTAAQTRPSTRPCIWPCASEAVQHGWDTRPCILPVLATAQNFSKVEKLLLLCFLHIWCIIDHILTCYAWINHLNDLQMLYLIKWLYDLLIYMICNSCILCVNMFIIHAGLIYGLSIHLEFVIMIKFIITIM